MFFCNLQCSASFNNKNRKPRTTESRLKTSLSVKSSEKHKNNIKPPPKLYFGEYTKIKRGKCAYCNKECWLVKYKKTCSPECARKICARKSIFKYQHQNETIHFDSSWEVRIAELLDSKNIQWSRPNHIMWVDKNNKPRKYFPDFYLAKYNIYLDPKNPQVIKASTDKLEYFKDKIKLYYGDVEYLTSIINDVIYH